MLNNVKYVDIVKWIATLIQLIGYGMTGLNLIPYKIFIFSLLEYFYGLLLDLCGKTKQ